MLIAYYVIRGVGYGLNENYSQLQLCLPFILLVGFIIEFSSMSLASSYLLKIEVACTYNLDDNVLVG